MRSIRHFSLSFAVGIILAMGCGGGGGGGSAPTPPSIQAPTGLTYSTNPAVYTNGVAITPNTPSSSGGAVASYSVSPPLPAGLVLNTATGVVSGTPTAVTATGSYTVTATNAGGSTTASLAITVNAAVAAPTGLTYSTNPAVYTNGVAITPNTPSSGGGAVVSYGVSPTLPAGLALNTTTGVVSGTPTAVTATASYTVTATNTAGSTTASLTITVNAAVVAPTGLTYSTNPAVYTNGVAITPNTPSSSGGAVASYSVSPPLPAGLVLNTATGVVSGTPTAVTATASYTVTATNTAGSTTASLTITVNAAVVAPTGLTYSTNPAVYTNGVAITPNTPSSGGGAVVSYSVNPALPAGLALNTTTGVVSGTPTAVTATASYTVTATNTAGSTTASLTITVNAAVVAPTGLTYSTNPAVYTNGVAITPNTPSSSGGAVANYGVNPALPSGLALDTTTGVVSGTPTAVTATASYTVTATNTGGDITASLTITVITAVPPVTPVVSIGTFVTSGKTSLTATTQDQGNGNTYTWSLLNGLITNGQGTPNILYTAGSPGALTANVTVSNPSGGASGSANATVVAVPKADIFLQGQVFYSDDGILASVEDQQAMSYLWTLQGGTFLSGSNLPVTTYSSLSPTGNFNLQVNVQNQAGDQSTQTRNFQIVSSQFLKDTKELIQRYGHTATLLPDGRVLIAGGRRSNPISDAELYDPTTKTWAITGSLLVARSGHMATLLNDGRVLVTGGSGDSSAELYDPMSGTWSSAGLMSTNRSRFSANLLLDGRVLVAGGFDGLSYLSSAELFDPITNTWSHIPGMGSARAGHTGTLLSNGTVLLAGGQYSNSGFQTWGEIYDPVKKAWSTTGGSGVRMNHTAALLANGNVLVVGGYNGVNAYLASGEQYNPTTKTWSNAGSLSSTCFNNTMTTLGNGMVLVAGGQRAGNAWSSIAELYDPTANSWSVTSNLLSARRQHTAILMENGLVLVAGGVDFAASELFDPVSNNWSYSASLDPYRYSHSATLLNDGKLLIAGGKDSSNQLASAVIYDPATGLWSTTGSLLETRYGHRAALLQDGRVLVVGGDGVGGYLSTAEIYSPSSGTWSSAASLSSVHGNASVTLLNNGKVLLTGGETGSSVTLGDTQLYNPVANTWSAAASLSQSRKGHSATLLANGKVLVAGGYDGANYLVRAEIYDPAANTWTTTSDMGFAQSWQTATLLLDGRVLLAGGRNSSGYLNSSQLYDPSTNSWTISGTLSEARQAHTATILGNGGVLVAGGSNGGGLRSAEFFDPSTNSWSIAGSLMLYRSSHTATLLGNGKVLIMGGDQGFIVEFWKPSLGPIQSLTVTASSGSNGTISPMGSTILCSGSHQTYTITPDSGFQVADVIVDGVSVGMVRTYTFTNLTSNHTISATFSPLPTYSLTISVGTGVTGSPATTTSYFQGSVVNYSYALQAGYQNLVVTLDGNPVAASGSLTMNGAHTLTAMATFPLTVSLSNGVTGTPSSTTSYGQGTVVNYSYGLQVGYESLAVTLDGSPVTASGSVAMNAAHTLGATASIKTFAITASRGGLNFNWGTISPMFASVPYGGSQTINIVTWRGQPWVWVDGVYVGHVPSWTFSNVTAHHTIEVQWQ